MTTTIKMLPGECWWGGTTINKKCPVTEYNEYHEDFRYDARNQTGLMFVSDLGRYIWSAEPFKVDAKDGVFTFEGGEIELNSDGTSLKEAYLNIQKAHFPSDKRRLNDKFFEGALYNTWMQFTYYPTQEKVLEYARDIIANGFEPGILIIDEGWHQHTAYGSWEFDFARFPDPKKMCDELHNLGFTLMLWVVPFVNAAGPEYVRSLRPLVGTDPEMAKHLYMRTTDGQVALIPWWNGACAILDFTDPYNCEFLDRKLKHLMDAYGVDGFKFDGGTTQHYAKKCLNGELATDKTPAQLNNAWNEFGLRYEFHEYKDSFCMGGKNAIQRLHDRAHSWTNNGLDDLLPCAFVNGLIGHPFTCPDMVGGGEWSTRYTPGFKVDEELFVRMAQCSALFPMLQFSWAPWEALSEKNLKLCRDMAKLHKRMAPDILRFVRSAEETGEPIFRLLEYNYPHKGYKLVQDEFMLDKEILVAPVLTPETYERVVVFPEGRWQAEDGTVYEGEKVITLPAPIEKLLWFKKL